MRTLATFEAWDWGIVGLYFALVTSVGLFIGWREKSRKRNAAETDVDYFLGNRSLPTWAVALSLVATMLSTATFVGVPDTAFSGDLTYLILNLGGILAVFIVGFLFVPRLYRAGTVTIYGFLAQRFGEGARIAVSTCFIIGRMLSSGARLFLAAIPLCLLLFGPEKTTFAHLALAIVLIGAVGAFYATVGGVKAVVWVDVIQFLIVVGTAVLTIAILLHRIPLHLSEIFQSLATAKTAAGTTKLHWLDFSASPEKPYTLWAALIGQTFFMTAAFGTDHDLAQRFLITKSAKKGALSVILSQFISIAVVSLFLLIGMLLFVFYARSGWWHPLPAEKTSIYPWFLLQELPTGFAGIAMAGLFAVAQGSLDSAMNALASSIVTDIWEPLRQSKIENQKSKISHAPKLTVAVVGIVLISFALLCAAVYDPKTTTLLDFALGVMTFAFSGMLAVFLTALLTRRGNSISVIAALLVGALVVALLQDKSTAHWLPHILPGVRKIAWPWWTPMGATCAFFVCIIGKPRIKNSPAKSAPAKS